MTPEFLLKTIYLGDRACKAILLDGWNERVTIQINQISRVRSQSGQWEFYTDEDIVDGLLVFTGVLKITFEPAGFLPNDLINSIEVEPATDSNAADPLYQFRCSIDSVDSTGTHTEVSIKIVAEGLHLEDPLRPGVMIRD